MSWINVGVAAYGIFSGNKSKKKAAKGAAATLAFQKEQYAELQKQKDAYRAIEFTNPYANMENCRFRQRLRGHD